MTSLLKQRKWTWSLLLLIGSLLLAISPVPIQGQLVGTVCISPTSSTSCPASPPSFSGTPGTQVTIAVNIQNSDNVVGYDISVVTDPSVLNASTVDFTGALINPCPPNIVCILPPAGGPGAVHVVETVSGSALPAPVTGRLFVISYNIVGLVSGTSITLPSVQVVGLVNGVVTAIPENTQEAGFTNVNMPFPIFVKVSPGFLALPHGSTATTGIVLTSFAGRVKLATTVTPIISNRPTAALSTNSVTLPGTVTLTITARTHTPIGNYIVTVALTNNGISGNLQIPVKVA